MFSDIRTVKNIYFAVKAKRILQVTLKEQEIKNPFKTLKDKKANTEIVINKSMTGIETLLDMMTITSQNGRESN